MSRQDRQISRRTFLVATGMASVMARPGLARDTKQPPTAKRGHWRVPVRITERAGIPWRGERICFGVVLPPAARATALRVRNESDGQILPCGAGYAGHSAGGYLRWCQLSLPLYLGPKGRTHLSLELLDDPDAAGAVVPAPLGGAPVGELDLSAGPAGVRWQSDARRGPLPVPTIGGQPVVEPRFGWCQLAIADLSVPGAVVGGFQPLASDETATAYHRIADPHLHVIDVQRRMNRGACGAGYELRQIHLYDLPGQDLTDQRPYAVCDLILIVNAGRDGVPLEVDGLSLLLRSHLDKQFLLHVRGDADDPGKRLRGQWERGLRLPAGDWMMAQGTHGRSMLVIPWSAYTLDGYDLSYFVGRNHTIPPNQTARRDGLCVALARNPCKLSWGTPGIWGRNTYEFRCRLAWGAIDESSAERLTRAYR